MWLLLVGFKIQRNYVHLIDKIVKSLVCIFQIVVYLGEFQYLCVKFAIIGGYFDVDCYQIIYWGFALFKVVSEDLEFVLSVIEPNKCGIMGVKLYFDLS